MRALVRIIVCALLLMVCFSVALGAFFSLLACAVPPLREVYYDVGRALGMWPGVRVMPGRAYTFVGGPFVGIGLSFVPLLLAALIALVVLRPLRGGTSKGRKGQETEADETRLMQDIYRGLARLEDRVDSLETILLEHRRRVLR